MDAVQTEAHNPFCRCDDAIELACILLSGTRRLCKCLVQTEPLHPGLS